MVGRWILAPVMKVRVLHSQLIKAIVLITCPLATDMLSVAAVQSTVTLGEPSPCYADVAQFGRASLL